MTSISVVVFILVSLFQTFVVLMDQESPPHCRDAGAQSGNETQFVFSEDDMRDSDADLINRLALGNFQYPLFSLSFCGIYNQQLGLSCVDISTA